MRRKLSTTVYLEPEQVAFLHALSASTRVPFAAFVREGVDLLIALHRCGADCPGEWSCTLPKGHAGGHQ